MTCDGRQIEYSVHDDPNINGEGALLNQAIFHRIVISSTDDGDAEPTPVYAQLDRLARNLPPTAERTRQNKTRSPQNDLDDISWGRGSYFVKLAEKARHHRSTSPQPRRKAWSVAGNHQDGWPEPSRVSAPALARRKAPGVQFPDALPGSVRVRASSLAARMDEVVMAAPAAPTFPASLFQRSHDLLWPNGGELVAHTLTATRSWRIAGNSQPSSRMVAK
jgi:hypothetical protein